MLILWLCDCASCINFLSPRETRDAVCDNYQQFITEIHINSAQFNFVLIKGSILYVINIKDDMYDIISSLSEILQQGKLNKERQYTKI